MFSLNLNTITFGVLAAVAVRSLMSFAFHPSLNFIHSNLDLRLFPWKYNPDNAMMRKEQVIFQSAHNVYLVNTSEIFINLREDNLNNIYISRFSVSRLYASASAR